MSATVEDTPRFFAGFANLSLEIIGFIVHSCSNKNFFALVGTNHQNNEYIVSYYGSAPVHGGPGKMRLSDLNFVYLL